MVDVPAVAGLTASLRAILEITETMRDVRDAELIQTKIVALTREIMSAQSCVLAAQSERIDLLQSKHDLEEEIARLKVWNAEKYRYELQSVAPGAIAYVLKQSMRGNEPVHWICADCFQSGKKRFLNESYSDLHFVYYKCQECAGKIRIRKSREEPLASESSDASVESEAGANGDSLHASPSSVAAPPAQTPDASFEPSANIPPRHA